MMYKNPLVARCTICQSKLSADTKYSWQCSSTPSHYRLLKDQASYYRDFTVVQDVEIWRYENYDNNGHTGFTRVYIDSDMLVPAWEAACWISDEEVVGFAKRFTKLKSFL